MIVVLTGSMTEIGLGLLLGSVVGFDLGAMSSSSAKATFFFEVEADLDVFGFRGSLLAPSSGVACCKSLASAGLFRPS